MTVTLTANDLSPEPTKAAEAAPEEPEASPAAAGEAEGEALDSLSLDEADAALLQAMVRPLGHVEGVDVGAANQVSVASFNMLLQGFEHKDYYPRVPSAVRQWRNRRPWLRRLLVGMDADVYLMQEVQCIGFEEEFAWLRDAGYGSVGPVDDSKGKRPDLAKCAVFYKAEKLELVWQEIRSRVVLAGLRHLHSGELVYVASCHLEGHPCEVPTRFEQITNALQHVGRHTASVPIDSDNVLLVVAGDFNENEDGAVCTFLREGSLGPDFHASVVNKSGERETVEATTVLRSHNFDLADLYWPGRGGSRSATFCSPQDAWEPANGEASSGAGGDRKPEPLDFLFYSRKTLRPLAVRRPMNEEQEAKAAQLGIPAAWHMSDHVPIGGVFALNQPSSREPVSDANAEISVV